jgi:hypothetical protein
VSEQFQRQFQRQIELYYGLQGELPPTYGKVHVPWVPQLSAFFHTKEAMKKRREILTKTRTKGKPRFDGRQFREVPDPYGPGTIREETPEYRRWRENVYMPWIRERTKATRWWKKTPERKRWRAESREKFRRWRRKKAKAKLHQARTKKRKGPFKKARRKTSVWWQKQRLKLVPKASKKVAARLRRERQARQAARHEREVARGRHYTHRQHPSHMGALVPFDNDDGTWLVFGVIGLLAGVGFIL